LESFKETKRGVEIEVTFNLYGLTAQGARRHEISHQRLLLKERDGKLTVREHAIRDREWSEASEPSFVDRTREVGLAYKHESFWKDKPVTTEGATPVIPGH